MKSKLILIALSFLIGHLAFGQNDANSKQSAFTLSLGADQVSLKDQTLSPIVFSGLIPNLRLGYGRILRNEKSWNTSLSVSVGDVNYDNPYFTTTLASAQLGFNYLWQVKSFGQSKVFLGGQFSSVINVLNYDGFDSGSWFSSQQLEPVLKYTYDISDHQSISGQFSYPILSLVSRPSYGGVDEFIVRIADDLPAILYSRVELYSLNKLINPNFELKYEYEMQKSAFSISANYSYLQVNSIRRYYKNRLGLNLSYLMKFGKNNEK